MQVYTDGSYNRKSAKDICGFAAIFVVDQTPTEYIVDILYGGQREPFEYVDMWNVGGELLAVRYATDLCIGKYKPMNMVLNYDYQGIESWATGRWKTNKPATKEYKAFMEKNSALLPIKYVKVRGHSGDILNELADKYAKLGVELAKVDTTKQDATLKFLESIRVEK